MDNDATLREQLQQQTIEELRGKLRDVVRDTQSDANEERRDLRKDVEEIKRTYWKGERLETFFQRVHDRLDGHDKKFWLAQGAWAAVVVGLEIYHKLKP